MQTTLRIALNDTQLDELRQLARHASGRVCQRAHFVIFSHKGYSPQHISALMDYSVNAIKKWLRAYMALGAAGLDDQPRSGRPVREPHLTDVLEAQASQAPTCFGYLQTTWTLALLVMHLGERLKILCSASTLRRARTRPSAMNSMKAIRYISPYQRMAIGPSEMAMGSNCG